MGLVGPLVALKPFSNNQFPLRLEPGDQYATSISSEVLIETFRSGKFQDKINVRGYIQSVFGEYQSSRTDLDIKKLESLVALVKDNARYKEYKDIMRSKGSLSMKSFAEIEQWLQNLVNDSFEIKLIN